MGDMTRDSGYGDWLLEHGLSENTIRQRLEFVDRWVRLWGTVEVSPATINRWLAQYEGWTRVTYYNHARSLYRFLVEIGALERDPMERMRRPPRPAPHPKPLTDEQVRLVLAHSSGDVRAWMLLAYLAGLRAHEIAKVRGEDVSPAAIYVVGKGGQGAAIPTHPTLWELAGDYPRDGFWFPNPDSPRGHISGNAISQRIGRLFRSLDIHEKGAVHRLRHSYCTQLSRNGVPPRVIQELMRHSSLVTTQMYIDVDTEEKRRAIAGLVA